MTFTTPRTGSAIPDVLTEEPCAAERCATLRLPAGMEAAELEVHTGAGWQPVAAEGSAVRCSGLREGGTSVSQSGPPAQPTS